MNDDEGDAHPPRGPQGPDFGSRLRDDFVMGLRFYSRIPVPGLPHEAPELNRITLALPFTSLAIGLLPALLLVVLRILGVPSLFAAGLAVLALVLITGAMTEDAAGDAADGLGGGNTATRRLEIMRDSSHGTYGICAIVLLLTLRVGAIASLAPLPAAGLWLASQLLSRSGALWLTVALPPARADGASAAVGGVTRGAFGVGAVFTLILAILLAFPWSGIVALIGAVALCAAVAFGWTLLCQRLVGGQTGDLIGALQGILEITALGAFLIFI